MRFVIVFVGLRRRIASKWNDVGSFSRHRGQPRPARRGQQREVEVRFGAPGVATSRTEPTPKSRRLCSTGREIDYSRDSIETELYYIVTLKR